MTLISVDASISQQNTRHIRVLQMRKLRFGKIENIPRGDGTAESCQFPSLYSFFWVKLFSLRGKKKSYQNTNSQQDTLHGLSLLIILLHDSPGRQSRKSPIYKTRNRGQEVGSGLKQLYWLSGQALRCPSTSAVP